MGVRESARVFEVAGARCVGVVSHPEREVVGACGVLILVGGPQYRVGSHRQFALLARTLAAHGYPAMRFDFRGMGDSEGAPVDFAATGSDIAAALAAFQQVCQGVQRVVLWGLCDAASAALIYAGEGRDPRLAGLCLVNPWVRSETGAARATVRYYYLSRLRDPDFWRKLRRGRVRWGESVVDFWRNLRRMRRPGGSSTPPEEGFQARMARGFADFAGPILLLLSGRDPVAREFEDAWRDDSAWHAAARRDGVTREALPEADHTCSSAASRAAVADAMLAWLSRCVDSSVG